MEDGDHTLEAVREEDDLDDYEDVEMLDVEEGELVDAQPHGELGKTDTGTSSEVKTDITGQKRRRKNKKKNKKNKKSNLGPNVTDVNRFVLDVCRHLKEKKSYLVYTAVGCLGVSALSDIVKEVDAIQTCGGQKTADGQRFRTGGGILWHILKTREPNAYKEIMKKGKEFEKQFSQPRRVQPVANKVNSQSAPSVAEDQGGAGLSSSENALTTQNQDEQQPVTERKRVPVHERMRVPVTYDDILTDEPDNPNLQA